MSVFLKFLFFVLFIVIGNLSGRKIILPTSLHNFKKNAGVMKTFEIYNVCMKCNHMHHQKAIPPTQQCSFVERPSHPLERHRQECKQSLINVVNLKSAKKIHYPLRCCAIKNLTLSS